MIFIDRREPGVLADRIRDHGPEVTCGPDVEFESGDIVFEGRGPGQRVVTVAFERKKLSDLVNSMKDRRLAGLQLRRLRRSYDFVYLIAEGKWRCARDGTGVIEVWGSRRERVNGHWVSKKGWVPHYASSDRRAVNHRQLTSFIHSLTLRAKSDSAGEPLRLIRTADVEETAAWVASLYYNFTEKNWDEHNSHDQIYSGLPKKGHGGRWGSPHKHNKNFGRVLLSNGDPTTIYRMAAQLPGVDRRAVDVAMHFGTMREAALAGLDPDLAWAVREWFRENPTAARDAWMEIGEFGVVKAEAVARAMSVEGA